MTTSAPVRNSMKQTAIVERTELGGNGESHWDGPTAGAVSLRGRSRVGPGKLRRKRSPASRAAAAASGSRSRGGKCASRLGADITEDDRVTIGSTLLLVETPPIERHGHKLVTMEILQREIKHAPLPLVWGSLELFWDSLELTWEDAA